MRSILTALAACLLSAGSLMAAISDGTLFLAEVKTALENRNSDKLLELTYTTGMPEAERAVVFRTWTSLPADQKISSASFAPNPKPYRSSLISFGRKLEPTAPTAGLLRFSFAGGSPFFQSFLPYTVIDGAYYLVGCKSTDLKWTGPPDKELSFFISGFTPKKQEIKVKYNRSGVDLEEEFDDASASLAGQFFSEISILNNDPAAEISLVVNEDGKEVFRSEPLRGNGSILYDRKAATAPAAAAEPPPEKE